ncbi:MAG: spermidine/putrescine ABC transporter substrate-binding protein PotF [Lysobacterales bacterium GWF1_69_6]|nr:MAG: spermidine/putrescine ABC transporter substrate-binding protein PotF [Xanthomonadales bacterium GWF1_69_6]
MILRYSLIASALLLAACSQSPEPPATAAAPAADAPAQGEKVVYVYNWSDYIAEDTIANFEAETGIKVVYDVYDNNEMLEAKLMAGASGYDLVFPSARPFAQRHIQAGVYAPLDKSKLSNLGNLDAGLLQGLQDVDPGNAHALPYMWGTTGLGINVAKVKEVLGEDAPLDSWSLLFDPANAEKLAACGISVLDDEQEAFAAALIWKGMDANALTGAETQAVTEAFAAIRPHVRYFNSSKYIDDLANGDICLAMGYSGDVFLAGDRAEESGNGVEIQYIIPKEGAVRWVDLMAIPKDAPHADNAHALMDYLLKPEVAAGITNYVAYASPNTAATPLVDPEISGDPGVYPPAEVLAKLVDPVTLPPETTRERVRAWTTIKTGQ